MPRPAQSYEVPYERLDHVVETERPLVAVPTAACRPKPIGSARTSPA